MHKILFLTKFFAPHVGGVEEHVAQLTQQFQQRGSAVTIITNQFEPNLPVWEKHDSYELYRLPFSAFDRKIPTWIWMLQHWWLIWQADVIHAHDVFWWILPLRFMFFWKKFAITFHGYEGINPPGRNQIRAHQLWNFLSTGSLAIGSFHDKWYHTRSSQHSFGAVSPLRTKKSTPKSTKHLKAIYVGRLAEDVGIMEYLKGLALVHQHAKPVSLDVFGDGPQREDAETFARAQKLPVKFHGFVPNAERKISEYDVAFLSRYLAILSGLQQGVPIVAHANTAIKYDYLAISPFVDWIVIAQNANEVASALTSLPSAKQLQAGKSWANQQSWSNLADVYERVWNRSSSR